MMRRRARVNDDSLMFLVNFGKRLDKKVVSQLFLRRCQMHRQLASLGSLIAWMCSEERVEEAMKKKMIAAAALAACAVQATAFANPVTSAAESVADSDWSVEARYFAPKLHAHVKSDSIDYNGGNVNVKDTLGIDDKKAPELILRYRRATLDWIHLKNTGNARLDGTLTVDNKTFDANSKVATDSKFDYMKLTIKNPLVKTPAASVNWSYGITGIHMSVKVAGDAMVHEGGQAAAYHQSASESGTVPVPMLGIGAQCPLGAGLEIYGNIEGLPLASYGHIYDFEAGLRYRPVDYLRVNLGYRKIDINVHHDDDEANYSLTGPFFGLAYDF